MNRSEIIYIALSSGLLFAVLVFNLAYAGNAQITGNAIAEHQTDRSLFDTAELISIPVKAHIIREQSGFYTSARDEENIKKTMAEANRIWEQAGIYFDLQEIVTTEVTAEAITTALNGNAFHIYHTNGFDDHKINVFFAQSLNNINGIALPNINAAIVADFTTVNDYRTTAHELGHILELRHVPEEDQLMAQGKNGELLSDDYILQSRTVAQQLLANNFYFE